MFPAHQKQKIKMKAVLLIMVIDTQKGNHTAEQGAPKTWNHGEEQRWWNPAPRCPAVGHKAKTSRLRLLCSGQVRASDVEIHSHGHPSGCARVCRGVSGCPRAEWVVMDSHGLETAWPVLLSRWGHQRQWRPLVRCKPLPEIFIPWAWGVARTASLPALRPPRMAPLLPTFSTQGVVVLWQNGWLL